MNDPQCVALSACLAPCSPGQFDGGDNAPCEIACYSQFPQSVDSEHIDMADCVCQPCINDCKSDGICG